jgi:RNA polymerase sigma-70 factor (ECF subfamily)
MAIAFDIRGLPHPAPPAKEPRPAAKLPAPDDIHARCARRISRHVGRVMGADDELEDLVQEVLVTVLRKVDTVRDPARFDGWVAQITTNSLRIAMRQRRLRRQTLGTFLAHQGDGVIHADFEARYAAERALRLIERLSPNERALLIAQWFTPGTRESVAASIAAKSGCSIATAERRLNRARKRFEKLARRDPVLAARLAETRGRHSEGRQAKRATPISDN